MQRLTFFLEILTVLFLLYLTGKFFFPKDILLLKGGHILGPIMAGAVLSLYYGLKAAAIFSSFYCLGGFFFYSQFPYHPILKLLLCLLIFSEFYYFWNRKIAASEEKAEYLEEYLRKIGTYFYNLKLAYEQLESQFLSKPSNLRNALNEILSLSNPHRYAVVLDVLNQFFMVEEASLYLLYLFDKGAEPQLKAFIGQSAIKWDAKDPLIEAFLEREATFTVAEIPTTKPLLAVIAVKTAENKLKGALLIGKMPFIEFNEDNILKMQVVLDYFFLKEEEEIIKRESDHKIPFIPEEIRMEAYRLFLLQKKFNIESSLVIIRTEDEADRLNLQRFLDFEGRRLLDQYAYSHYRFRHYFWFLLPFTNKSGAFSFLKRVRDFSRVKDSEKTQSLITHISDLKHLESWIKQ